MTMTRLDTFSGIKPWRDAMDRFFDEATRPLRAERATRSLPIDVYETPDELVIKADLPGVDPEKVQVTLERGNLTIQAERIHQETSDQDRWLHREIGTGSYLRTIVLPSTLQEDQAVASHEYGVLTLRIPKAEKAKPRRIPVTAGS